MPIRDAVRTCILSSKWRYSWTNMPKLVFDDEFVNALSDSEGKMDKYKLVSVIYHILLHHKGPISELCIHIDDTEIINEIVNEINQIIHHLSWSKNIKKFVFEVTPLKHLYKLPRSFFSLQGLEHIFLKNCQIELPITFSGFSMLKSLVFQYVSVSMTVNKLQQFLTGCPLLEQFTMIREEPLELTECEFIELFKCLPSVQVLEIFQFFIMDLGAGGMPHKLPFLLPQLRIFVLDVCFLKLSSVLCVINSSPNLEKIRIELCWNHRWCPEQTFNNVLDGEDYACLKLDHLKELEMISFHNYAPEMEFVKLIMAKSPVLKKARIKLSISVSVDEENKMLRDLLYLPLPRASLAGKFIMERPKFAIQV